MLTTTVNNIPLALKAYDTDLGVTAWYIQVQSIPGYVFVDVLWLVYMDELQ